MSNPSQASSPNSAGLPLARSSDVAPDAVSSRNRNLGAAASPGLFEAAKSRNLSAASTASATIVRPEILEDCAREVRGRGDNENVEHS